MKLWRTVTVSAKRFLYNQSYGFSSRHIWMWQLNHKEGWALKNWWFWIVVLEKTLESPLASKEIQPVHPKGNQPWILTGRIDAKTEAPILWPPDVKSQLIGKDPDAGKDWVKEAKGVTENEMVGWHHRFNGHEFEQTPRDSEGQRSQVCCSVWGHRIGYDLATEQQWQQAFSWKTACLDIYYNMMHRVIFFLIINNAFHLLSIYHVLAPFPYCVCRGNAKIAIELNSLPFTSLNKLQNNPYFPYGLCPSEDCIAKETDC